MDYLKELKFAKNLARKAGKIMQEYSSTEIDAELKNDDSPVTLADQKINDLVIDEVFSRYPKYGVLGEEASNFNGQEYVWVCDPIDGTAAYIINVPTSMFSLALVRSGEPIVALAYNPWTGDMYSAIKGQGSFCNDKAIHVSDKTFAQGAVIANSASGTSLQSQKKFLEMNEAIEQMGGRIATVPGTVFKGCLVASGFIAGRLFPGDGAHDIAAVKLIVEEAGGKCTSLDGSEQRYDKPINGAIISNGVIHEELVKLYENYWY